MTNIPTLIKYRLLQEPEKQIRRCKVLNRVRHPTQKKQSQTRYSNITFCAGIDVKENFCAAGEYHSDSSNSSKNRVYKLTETRNHTTLQLEAFDIHAKL